MDNKQPRHWWVHSNYDVDSEAWFVPCLMATRNMWEKDNTKVIEVVEWEPIRMEIIKLESEIARLINVITPNLKLKALGEALAKKYSDDDFKLNPNGYHIATYCNSETTSDAYLAGFTAAVELHAGLVEGR